MSLEPDTWGFLPPSLKPSEVEDHDVLVHLRKCLRKTAKEEFQVFFPPPQTHCSQQYTHKRWRLLQIFQKWIACSVSTFTTRKTQKTVHRSTHHQRQSFQHEETVVDKLVVSLHFHARQKNHRACVTFVHMEIVSLLLKSGTPSQNVLCSPF